MTHRGHKSVKDEEYTKPKERKEPSTHNTDMSKEARDVKKEGKENMKGKRRHPPYGSEIYDPNHPDTGSLSEHEYRRKNM